MQNESNNNEVKRAEEIQTPPWRKAMNYMLIGTLLGLVDLQFGFIRYMCPIVAQLLMIAGARALRKENGFFKVYWITCALLTVKSILVFALAATPYFGMLQASVDTNLWFVLPAIVPEFVLLGCLWGGFWKINQTLESPISIRGVAMLFGIYAALAFFVAVGSTTIAIRLVFIAYIWTAIKVVRIPKKLESTGFNTQIAPTRVSNVALVGIVSLALLAGVSCGYLFFDNYPMDWEVRDVNEHADVEEIKAQLLTLDFPEDVLNDLTADEIQSCENAKKVTVFTYYCPVNDNGRIVKEYFENYDVKEHIVYDVKELRFKTVIMEFLDNPDQWKVFHQFFWEVDPHFCGTEGIQLQPAQFSQGYWKIISEPAGRVLYDEGETTYVSPYFSVDSEPLMRGFSGIWNSNSTEYFANFSLPNHGGSKRGYLTYDVQKVGSAEWTLDIGYSYIHQQELLQYPAKTAKEYALTATSKLKQDGPFIIAEQAPYRFYPLYDEIVDVSRD